MLDIYNDDFFEFGEKIIRRENELKDLEERFDFDVRDSNFNFEEFGPWGYPWPEIPGGGEPLDILEFIEEGRQSPCSSSRWVMGYYIPWHFRLEEAYKKYRKASEEAIENIDLEKKPFRRWGIHLCMDNIINYVDDVLMNGANQLFRDSTERKYFRDYAIYLLAIKTLSHEWGHYRSEVLAIEQQTALRSLMKPKDVNRFSGNFLTYFRNTAGLQNNFEEVFAEWCALRLGIFNFKMIRPDDSPKIIGSRREDLTRDWLIRLGALESMKRNVRPYSDIVQWVDFNALSTKDALNSYVNNKVGISKLVGRNTEAWGYKIIDLLMNNINFYSAENIAEKRIALIRSNQGSKVLSKVSSMRPGIGVNSNPQVPLFDMFGYGNPKKIKSVLSLNEPLKLDSFHDPIYRFPLENFDILPVKVYL